MTKAYVFNNPCVLAVNTAWNNVHLEGYRKGLYTEIFLMFIVYFASQVLHAFKFKNRTPRSKAPVPYRKSSINEDRTDEQNPN